MGISGIELSKFFTEIKDLKDQVKEMEDGMGKMTDNFNELKLKLYLSDKTCEALLVFIHNKGLTEEVTEFAKNLPVALN